MYPESALSPQHILDRWIISRLNQVIAESTAGYESYQLDDATRPIADFVDDLSTWYLRRSRDRFKNGGEDKEQALATLSYVLKTIAHVMAPVMPFFAEHLYLGVRSDGEAQSVHLCEWPTAGAIDTALIDDMQQTRKLASVGLQVREKLGMKLRQPLAKLVAQKLPANLELQEVLKDELNIKEVAEDASQADEMWLDTVLTPALKEEGVVREYIRKIQGWRKDQNMQMSDRPAHTLTASAEDKQVIEKNKAQILEQTGLSSLEVQLGE